MASDDRLIDGCTYRAAIIRDESKRGKWGRGRDTTELKTRSICVTEIMSSTRNGSPQTMCRKTRRNEVKQSRIRNETK